MPYSFSQLASESAFQPFIRDFEKGKYLFHQGQAGQTFFVVLKGNIQLIQVTDQGEHVFARVIPNGILGEKSLLEGGARHRYFSAQAETDVRVLELSLENLKSILSKKPQLLFEILKRCLEVTVERLDKANYLAKCLRGSDNDERLKKCLIYLSQIIGIKKDKGIEIPQLRSALNYYLGFSEAELDKALEAAIKDNVLCIEKEENFVLLSDESLLKI